LSRTPSNETSTLVSRFTEKIQPEMTIKYHLAWTYGDYLYFVPPRLGHNEALDAATDTLVTAVSNLTDRNESRNTQLLEKYGRALSALRRCVADPDTAKEPETLCAITFLWNCQVRGLDRSTLWTGNG
jgi:hypothetical protein